MKILKAFKFRLKTNSTTLVQLASIAGSNRFVWNKALAHQKERLENKEYTLSYYKMALLLLEWKKEHTFLGDCPSQSLQQTLMAQERAIKDAFNKKSPKKFPMVKKKGQHDSFRYPQGIKVSDNRVFLPKIGWVGFFKSRDILGKIKNATVSKKGEHWFVSIQTELEAANIQQNYLHQVSTDISKNHALVVLEDLKVANMSKSASGTLDEPGKMVAAKSGLNRSILDQGWHSFKSMLSYKLGHLGGELLLVDPRYTSQKCSSCGHTEKDNRMSQAEFAFMRCGFRENADVNAAKNVLVAGHAVLSLQPEVALAA